MRSVHASRQDSGSLALDGTAENRFQQPELRSADPLRWRHSPPSFLARATSPLFSPVSRCGSSTRGAPFRSCLDAAQTLGAWRVE